MRLGVREWVCRAPDATERARGAWVERLEEARELDDLVKTPNCQRGR